MGQVDEIVVYINSPGGDVFQGNTIYNLLKSHKARKRVEVVGVAASIASVIAMAGDEIRIAENGFFFIHDAHATAYQLNAAQMRRTADELDLVSETIAETYARRAKKDALEMRKMMRKEVLLNAKESIEAGLADKTMDPAPIDNVMRHFSTLSDQHKDAVDAMRAQLQVDAAKNSVELDESRQEEPSDAPADQKLADVTADEIKDRRDRMDLAFMVADRRLRESAERVKRFETKNV